MKAHTHTHTHTHTRTHTHTHTHARALSLSFSLSLTHTPQHAPRGGEPLLEAGHAQGQAGLQGPRGGELGLGPVQLFVVDLRPAEVKALSQVAVLGLEALEYLPAASMHMRGRQRGGGELACGSRGSFLPCLLDFGARRLSRPRVHGGESGSDPMKGSSASHALRSTAGQHALTGDRDIPIDRTLRRSLHPPVRLQRIIS